MNFIPEAKQAWRFTSVQIMALLAVLAFIETKWDIISPLIPEPWRGYAVTAFAIAGIVARLWPQPVSTEKAMESKIESLSSKVNDYDAQLKDPKDRDPIEHNALLDKVTPLKIELDRMWAVYNAWREAKVRQKEAETNIS